MSQITLTPHLLTGFNLVFFSLLKTRQLPHHRQAFEIRVVSSLFLLVSFVVPFLHSIIVVVVVPTVFVIVVLLSHLAKNLSRESESSSDHTSSPSSSDFLTRLSTASFESCSVCLQRFHSRLSPSVDSQSEIGIARSFESSQALLIIRVLIQSAVFLCKAKLYRISSTNDTPVSLAISIID
jgi:hypothetical protein